MTSNGAMPPSGLVILTMNYPEACGDGAFVRNEIDQLVAEFGHVVVVPLLHQVDSRLPLPEGVQALTPVLGRRREAVLKGLRGPADLSAIRELLRDDLSSLRRGTALSSFASATLIGRAIARHGPLRHILECAPGAPLYSYWGAGTAYALPWLTASSRRIVVRFHGGDLYEERHEGYLPFRKAIMGRADLLIAISDHGKRHLESQVAGLGLHTPVALNRIGTFDHGVRPARDRGRPRHVVSCSSLIPLKNVPRIFAALCVFAEREPVHWTHFGGGRGMQELVALLKTRPSGLTVDLVGHVPNEAIHAFYRDNHVDCFVNLSDYEGIPVSLMEALSHDIPAVATDVGGSGELVGRELGTGTLVDRRASSHDVADTIRDVCETDVWQPRRFWFQRHHAPTQATLAARLVGG